MCNTASFNVRLQSALSLATIIQKCEELNKIIDECSSKDASFVLRAVVENIFEVGGQSGWGLRAITYTEHKGDFSCLRSFLGATGPLLNLTYRLSHDPFILFEYPISWLPAKAQSDIETGTPSAFFVDKIQNISPGKTPSSIMLNAFEFYVLHFAMYLINESIRGWSLSWSSVGDALYPTLLEDYLVAYLPCDSSIPPGPSSLPVSPRTVFTTVSRTKLDSCGNPSYQLTSPFPTSPFKSPSGTTVGESLSASLHISHFPHLQLNIWTSQVAVQIFLEMWVIQSTYTPSIPVKTTFTSHASSSLHSGSSEFVSSYMTKYSHETAPLEYRPFWQSQSFNYSVPSTDLVRIVRMIIKHLHYFSNSVKLGQPSPLDGMRKNLWPMCRKYIYKFFHHLFSHWPMDSSFQTVLQTWLSYIQPWRYTTHSTGRSIISPSNEGEQLLHDSKWLDFISENLLFYSFFFENVVSRLLLADLSAPQNAQMLFRVAKVYSQGNLKGFIREIEDALETSHHLCRPVIGGVSSPTTAQSFLYNSHTSILEGSSHSLQSFAANARSHILEVEGPNFNYSCFFGVMMVSKVTRLIVSVNMSYESTKREYGAILDSHGRKSTSLWSLFLQTFDMSVGPDEVSVEEIKKILHYLEMSKSHLCSLFNLYDEVNLKSADQSNLIQHDSFDSSFDKNKNIPDQVLTQNGLVLSDSGRVQLLRGLKRLDIKYDGDPELHPICSHEVPFLVRWLYSVTVMVNTKFEADFIGLYYRSDVFGRLARILLTPPLTVYEYRKNSYSAASRQRIPKDLPPRISLRFLASKFAIILLLMMYILSIIVGPNFLFSVLLKICLPLTFGYLLFRVIKEPSLPVSCSINSISSCTTTMQ